MSGMKQSLQLRLGQHLTMTPQLQQAIRLLQLSTIELDLEIQQALDSNMMLEVSEESDERDPLAEGAESNERLPEATERHESTEGNTETEYEADGYDQADSFGSEQIPDDLPVDSAWEDIYDNINTGSGAPDDDDREFEIGDASGDTLHEHLSFQLRLTPLSELDQRIGEAIIDAVDEDGFLSVPLESIHEGLSSDLTVDFDEVVAVLHTVQNFDPPGVAARDLRESLFIQLKQIPATTPWRADALVLIEEHFDLLASRDYNGLKRKLKLEEEQLARVIRLIQSLNPRPGGQISKGRPEYVVPDVIVRKHKGAWRVELNPETAPRLRINASYANLIKKVTNQSESATLKHHLQEARWFIKSLQSRNETLLKVATSIVEHQKDFLEQGEVAMKALVLRDIAEEVGMHESTISRVTTRKYMHTPRGIFELKYFFSSHVGTASGEECSSTAIRALIKKLIAEENLAKPLSDSKIAEILAKEGINVARRTVAKYREAMAIPPSNERKRLA